MPEEHGRDAGGNIKAPVDGLHRIEVFPVRALHGEHAHDAGEYARGAHDERVHDQLKGAVLQKAVAPAHGWAE